ncbi:MAG: hypothetical protein I8H91_01640 [Burkholderiales bacterium]|nr:hypothetical protein [Burkholderiales bacterium]
MLAVVRAGAPGNTHSISPASSIIEHRPKVFFTQPRLQSPTGSTAVLSHLHRVLACGALVDGRWRKHIKTLRDRLALGQRRLASLLLAIGFELFCEPKAGMFLWARHPAIQNAGELAYNAAEQDILLGPGHLFSVDLEPGPWLRFNVAWSDDEALLRFLVTLKAA